jgi:hypothetical protein
VKAAGGRQARSTLALRVKRTHKSLLSETRKAVDYFCMDNSTSSCTTHYPPPHPPTRTPAL